MSPFWLAIEHESEMKRCQSQCRTVQPECINVYKYELSSLLKRYGSAVILFSFQYKETTSSLFSKWETYRTGFLRSRMKLPLDTVLWSVWWFSPLMIKVKLWGRNADPRSMLKNNFYPERPVAVDSLFAPMLTLSYISLRLSYVVHIVWYWWTVISSFSLTFSSMPHRFQHEFITVLTKRTFILANMDIDHCNSAGLHSF